MSIILYFASKKGRENIINLRHGNFADHHLMEYGRTILYQGWQMDVLIHKFSNGTLLLFAFFMITDPMSIPNSRGSRIIWAIVLATGTFVLTNWMQLHTAPIWILFFMTPVTVLLDKVFPSLKFQWWQTITNRSGQLADHDIEI